MEKIECMRRAIELARLGEGWTNPNPLVGAVIVRDGIIIGEGFHHCYGGSQSPQAGFCQYSGQRF